MKKKENQQSLEEIKKQIVIERLRQAPSNIKVSFGMSDGRFLNRDELIEQVESESDMGKKIIEVQMAYLKAFKRHLMVGE